MGKVIIFRGLPGSGKSTEAHDSGVNVVCSADDYFMVDGVYRYDASKIGEAHTWCMRQFLYALEDDFNVAVDNTNMRLFELSPYRLVALAKGYEVEVVHVVCANSICAKRNKHGVPAGVIWRMSNTFEPMPLHLGGERIIDNSEEK